MGVKVHVGESETLPEALRRFRELVRRTRSRPRRKGLRGWMFVTNEYYQKPGLLRRMKRASRRLYTRLAQSQRR
jgi:ribosomal protein S21